MMPQSLQLQTRQEQRQAQKVRLDYIISAHTRCPECDHEFDPETEKGWSEDPNDCTITCPQCGNQFTAQLEVEPQIIRGPREIHRGFFNFLCPLQTLYEMRKILRSGKRKVLGKQFLHDRHPKIYFSIIKNFGSYRKARVQV